MNTDLSLELPIFQFSNIKEKENDANKCPESAIILSHGITHFTGTILCNHLLIFFFFYQSNCLVKNKTYNRSNLCKLKHYTAAHKLFVNTTEKYPFRYSEMTREGRLQYLQFQKEILQIGEKKKKSHTD